MQCGVFGALSTRIGRRVVTQFVLCALVPLVTIAGFALTQVSEELVAEARARLRRSAKSLGMTVMERLLILDADLEALSTEVGNRGRTLAVATARIHKRLESRFSSLAVVDPGTRRILATSLEVLESVPVLDAADLEHFAKGLSAIHLLPGNTGGPKRVLFLRLIEAQPSAVLLVGEVDPEYLWGGHPFVPPDTELLVLGPARHAVYESDDPPPIETVRRALAMNSNSGFFDFDMESATNLGAYWRLFARPRFNTDWVFGISKERDSVLASLITFQTFFLLVAALTILSITLLSLTQIRRSLGPISQLEIATRMVTKGDFDVEIEVTSRDEFEELAHRFREMVAALVENIARRELVESNLTDARDRAILAANLETEFVQNVSHELRTPMTSIRSFAEILRDYGDEDPQTRAEFLDIIIAESDRLSRLVEDILDFSQIRSGNEEWELAKVGVDGLLEETLRTMAPIVGDAKITLQTSFRASRTIFANIDRMRQVFTNLVSNAIKFSPKGGSIAISSCVRGDEIIVEVQDWGCGIGDDDQEAIFQRFRQVSTDSTTEKPAGTGLGLAITKDIVLKHGGRIEIDSEVGVGSTFRVCLPVLPGSHCTPVCSRNSAAPVSSG